MMDDGLFVLHISRGKDADAGADGQSWLGIFAHTRYEAYLCKRCFLGRDISWFTSYLYSRVADRLGQTARRVLRSKSLDAMMPTQAGRSGPLTLRGERICHDLLRPADSHDAEEDFPETAHQRMGKTSKEDLVESARIIRCAH